MDLIVLSSLIVSFFTTFFAIPFLIKFLRRTGVVGIDQHKKNKPILPSSGGLAVSSGILGGLLTYIGLTTFLVGISNAILYLFAIMSSVLIVTLIGLLDDLNVIRYESKKRDIRVGLPQWLKPLLTLPAAIPLMVISVGDSTVNLPFFGIIDFGILYPLLLIPIGFIGASNAINMLGGFNGSESGMGIVYMLTLGIFAFLNQSNIAILFLVAAVSLIGFIIYNWYPAKILPGDSLTYLLGALVAGGVIAGNMEKLGIILITPFIVEFLLKMKSKFKASSLGLLKSDGKLYAPYGKKIYSITHLIMNIKTLTEKQITLTLILMQIVVSLIGFYLIYFHFI